MNQHTLDKLLSLIVLALGLLFLGIYGDKSQTYTVVGIAVAVGGMFGLMNAQSMAALFKVLDQLNLGGASPTLPPSGGSSLPPQQPSSLGGSPVGSKASTTSGTSGAGAMFSGPDISEVSQ